MMEFPVLPRLDGKFPSGACPRKIIISTEKLSLTQAQQVTQRYLHTVEQKKLLFQLPSGSIPVDSMHEIRRGCHVHHLFQARSVGCGVLVGGVSGCEYKLGPCRWRQLPGTNK